MLIKILKVDQSWLLAINHFANSSPFWQVVFKIGGEYLIYAVPVGLVILWFWSAKSKKIALRATLAGAASWLIFARILGEIINRPRPFETGGVKEILFHRPTYSFPSDHAAFFFAMAFSFYFSGYKKLAYFSLATAGLMSLARIGLGFHFPLDIIAGAIIGLIVAWLVWLFDRPLNYLYNFLITIAKKLYLA
jgi:undecaprenyl-diphosphatase